MNGETLTSHLANFEKLFQKYQFDAERIWNLDETGATPGKDVEGRSSSRPILRRHDSKDIKIGQFLNVHRVTAMTVISAAGKRYPTLFVLGANIYPMVRFCEMEKCGWKVLQIFCHATLWLG